MTKNRNKQIIMFGKKTSQIQDVCIKNSEFDQVFTTSIPISLTILI